MSKELSTRIVTRDAYVRSTTAEMLENRQVEFVISSDAVDSYNTVFKMSGWDLNRYAQNPIVCYQHRSHSDDPDNLIGTSTIRVEDNKLIGTVTFEDADVNPRAEKIFRKVQAGTLRMASVGARVLKAHLGDEEKNEDKEVLYFDRSELIEWSIVSVGANPDAHKRNQKTLEEIRTTVVAEIPVTDVVNVKKRSVQEAQILINNNRFK
jgi:HK97 family phage prohead protease